MYPSAILGKESFEYLNISPRYTYIRIHTRKPMKRMHKDVGKKMTTRFGLLEFFSGQKSQSNCFAFFSQHLVPLSFLISLFLFLVFERYSSPVTFYDDVYSLYVRNSDVPGLFSVSLSLVPASDVI